MPAAALGATLLLAAAPPALAARAEFSPRPVPVQPDFINDLGIADFDADGKADIYSTNHSHPSSFLRNDGGWAFADVQSSLGFDQTPAAPSWNRLNQPPDMDEPGLYIWAGWDTIEIRSTEPSQQAEVRLGLYSPVAATTDGGAEVAILQGAGNPPPTEALLSVPAGAAATLTYTTPGHSFESTALTVDDAYPLERVHLGAAGESPASRVVPLNLQDRHSMVWGQFDAGREPDVFIARGGLKRSVYEVDRRPSDELFVNESGLFKNRAFALGLGNQVCSGREGRQLDLGSGDAAELLIACRSALPRIYRRGLFGFTPRNDELPRQMRNASWYLPFELAPGQPPTLIIRRNGKVHLVAVRRRQWTVLQTLKLKTKDSNGRNHKRIARGDLDGDGDMDAFVPDPAGSTVLVNRDGRLKALAPASRGLPRSSSAAAIADFDLDGRPDIHLLPQGIFRQRTRNRFSRQGEPDLRGSEDAADLSVSWADLDGDLDLDALIGEQPAGSGSWQVRGLENTGEVGNAIAVHAAGRIENAPAFGARVTVDVGDRPQVGWIGQNNTNSYGQGNYDLVFGLGGQPGADRVVIEWPDGTRSVRGDVAAGTRLVVNQPRPER